MRRALKWLLALAVCAGGIATLDAMRWHERLQAELADAGTRAGELLAARFAPDFTNCPEAAVLDGNERAVLNALYTVEIFATGWPEKIAEWSLVRGAQILGVSPPDLSYGPGQIRLSKALNLQSESTLSSTTPADMAARLVDTCASLTIARALLRDLGRQQTSQPQKRLTRSEIESLARAWNGSTNRANGHAALSSAIYGSLTYNLVMADYYRNK